MLERFDVAVVGAGILGLAHAYHLARRGLRVVVFERGMRASGASVRNFGMLWPIGQPAGSRHGLALRSLEHWGAVLAATGIWHRRSGSVHLAYHDDEAEVLREFAARAPEFGYDCSLLDASAVLARTQGVNPEGLRLGLASPTEIGIDPREAVAGLADYLSTALGVRFVFGATVSRFERPCIRASGRDWEAPHLIVCSGEDLQTLYPEAVTSYGLRRCKLQMLRSQAYGDEFRLGPMLAAGSTLRHYQSFECCPTLPEVRARFARDLPAFDRYGIHVMAAQNGRGEVILGDSHEYDDAIEPFDKSEIDDLILGYLSTFLKPPGLRITSRWHGIYVKHPTEPFLVRTPDDGVTAVNGVGGAGMTLSFGLAEQVVNEVFGTDEART